MTTGNLDTVYSTYGATLPPTNANSAPNQTSILSTGHEREKIDSPVLVISASSAGQTSGLKRKGSMKNMLDKFSSRSRAGPGEQKEDRKGREEDEDGVGWDMMSAKPSQGEWRSSDTGAGSVSVSAPGSNEMSRKTSGSISGSGSGRPSADSSKDGYSARDIVPRLSVQDRGDSRPGTQAGCLAVPGGKVKRRPSWRKAGRKEKEKEKEVKQEEDDGIGAPMLVQVSAFLLRTRPFGATDILEGISARPPRHGFVQRSTTRLD